MRLTDMNLVGKLQEVGAFWQWLNYHGTPALSAFKKQIKTVLEVLPNSVIAY